MENEEQSHAGVEDKQEGEDYDDDGNWNCK